MNFSDIFFSDTFATLDQAGRWFVIGWLFVMGGVFGSFMNVVVYRLPLRMSLSRPASRCPVCEHPIRWYDNLPILGWLVLGGRCRDCKSPISTRYPLVELLVAITSALLAWAECFTPIAMPSPDLEPAFALDLGPYAFHLFLIATLYCAALMRFDGQLAPPQMLAVVLAVGLAVAALWPDLRGQLPVGEMGSPWRGVYEGALGLLVSILFGALAWPGWMVSLGQPKMVQALTAATELELVGAFLGAESVSVIAALTMVLFVKLRFAARIWPGAGRIGWAAALSAVTLIYLIVYGIAWPFFERQLSSWADNPLAVVVAAGAVVAVLAILLWIVESRPRRSPAL